MIDISRSLSSSRVLSFLAALEGHIRNDESVVTYLSGCALAYSIAQIFRILIGIYSRGVHVSIGMLLGYLHCTSSSVIVY